MSQDNNLIPDLEVITDVSGKHPVYRLEAPLRLRVWAGFNAAHSYFDELSDGASEGRVRAELGGGGNEEDPQPGPAQVAAYRYLTVHQESIRDNILDALLRFYPALRERYAYSEEEAAELMPAVSDAAQFRDLIGLAWIHILDKSRDGSAYVGYEFGCTWDEEHGLGVLTHQNRIVDIGDADMAFADWRAEKDRMQ